MNNIKISLFIIAFSWSFLRLEAQSSTNNIWSDLNLSYRIFKNFDVKYELGNRINNNQARTNYNDFVVKYSFNNFFKIALGTRRSELSLLDSSISITQIEDHFEEISDRFHFDISGRVFKLNGFRLKYRLRSQRKIIDFYSDAPVTYKRTYIRTRGIIEYDLTKKLKTSGGSELFFSFEDDSPVYIRKHRYMAALEYDFNKIYSARIQYLYQKKVKPLSEEFFNILAFHLKIDLNELTQKFKSKN